MRKGFVVFLCLLWVVALFGTAHASELTIMDGSVLLEELDQFPFLAQTGEAAVNVRAEMDTKSGKIGRLERGENLTVIYADLNERGEM